jgi:hypothetical protein
MGEYNNEMDMIQLNRVAMTDDGTFGVLLQNGKPFALTLERQWLDNKRNVSCIPAGKYMAVRCNKSVEYGYRDSPKFGDTFVVESVPGRSKILFHKGNIDDDSHGCILVGEQFGKLGRSTAILSSKDGFNEFLKINRDLCSFMFEVIESY